MPDTTSAERGVDPFAIHKTLVALVDPLRELFAAWHADRRPLMDAMKEFGDPTSLGVDLRNLEYASRWLEVGRVMRADGLVDLPRKRLAKCHTRISPGGIPDDGLVIEMVVWSLLDRAAAGDESGVIGLLADAGRHLGGRDPAHFAAHSFGVQVRDVWRDVQAAWEAIALPGYVDRLRGEVERRGLTFQQVKAATFPELGLPERLTLDTWLDGWEGERRTTVAATGETQSLTAPAGAGSEVVRETRSGNEPPSTRDREALQNAAIAVLISLGQTNLSEIARRVGIPRSTLHGYPRFMEALNAARGVGEQGRDRLRGDRDRGDDFSRDEDDAGEE